MIGKAVLGIEADGLLNGAANLSAISICLATGDTVAMLPREAAM